ncbi:hypothetical protein FRC11_011878, partial [Ceratobasidium sp. 423]
MSSLCSSSFNHSSRYSSPRDHTDKVLLRFSEEFVNPSDKISKWYSQQPYKHFRSIQYRKEKTGVRHEFILLQLRGEAGDEIKSFCRVERTGDPEHRLQTICIDGTIAEDYIQAIPLDMPESAGLTQNSDVVAKIAFPLTFDLRDVLAICYGVSRHKRAKRYTLQQYNCYFFSWTIILALARACVKWDVSSSIPELIHIIRSGVLKSINEQGPARFNFVAYILSNSAYPSHENGEGHPLDQNIRSWLHSPKFAGSISGVLSQVLWGNRPQHMVMVALSRELSMVAMESTELLPCNETQHRPIEAPVGQSEHDLNFENAVRELTWKVILTGTEMFWKNFASALAEIAPDASIMKRRVGHELRYKYLKSLVRHPIRAVHYLLTTPGYCEPTEPHPYPPIESSIRDRLFIPPSAILGLCVRIVIACGIIGISFGQQINLEFRLGGHGNGDTFRRIVRCIGNSVRYGTLSVVGMTTAFEQYQRYVFFMHSRLKLGAIYFDFIDHKRLSELERRRWEWIDRSLGLLNDGLQSLIKDRKGTHLSFLRPYLFAVTRDLTPMIRGGTNVAAMWELIILQHFLHRIVEITLKNLEVLMGESSTEVMFWMTGQDEDGLPQGGVHRAEKVNPHHLGGIEAPNVASHGPDPWSYEKLQRFIRERISLLSKRENEFAPLLRHIPLAKSPKTCQRQIEDSMEEIWQTCYPLLVTRPQAVSLN